MTTIGADAVNQIFDFTFNWAGNVIGATGIKNSFSAVIEEEAKMIAAVGFALSYITAVRYALKGEKYQAASTAYQGYFSLITGAGFSWIDTAASSAAGFATTFISYALNKGYSDTLDANEKKWYDVFNTYYKRGGDGYRPVWIWRDTLAPILDSSELTAEEKYSKVRDEVTNYAWELWNDPTKIAYVFGETQTKALKGGLNFELENKLSNQLIKRLYEDEIKKVYEWYRIKGLRDAQDALQKQLDLFAEETEKDIHIEFYDNTVKSGKTSKLKNAIASKVKWTTSSKKTATVKSGKVTAKKKETATITATYKNKKYKCKLTVKAKANKMWRLVKTENIRGEGYRNKTYKNGTSTISLDGNVSNSSFSVEHIYNDSSENSSDHEGECVNETYSAVCAMTTPKSTYKAGETTDLTLTMSISHGNYFCSDYGWCNFYAKMDYNLKHMSLDYSAQSSEACGLTAWAPSGSSKTVYGKFKFPSTYDNLTDGDEVVISSVVIGPTVSGGDDIDLTTTYTYRWS